MAVYDFISFGGDFPDPNLAGKTFKIFDMDCPYHDRYMVMSSGALYIETYDVEDRSDKSLPIGSPMRLFGCATRVNKSMVPTSYSGTIELYSESCSDLEPYRVEFRNGIFVKTAA